MSTSKLSVVFRYLVIAVLTWAVSVLVAEGVFRLQGDKTAEDENGLFIQFMNGSYKPAPHVDLRANYASGSFSLHTDDLGLRCDRDRKHAIKNGEAIDILFIGDSQGFGNGVDFEDSIAGGVAELAAGRGIRCANASVGGHALRNQLELIQWLHDQQNVRASHYVILFTPPMVINACDSFNRAVVGSDGRLYDKTKNKVEMGVIWIKTHSLTYPRLRNAFRNMGIGVDPERDVPFIFRIYDARLDEEESIRKLVSCLTKFQDFIAIDGATLSVVYLPLTIEVDFSSVRQAATGKGLRLDPDLPMRVLTGAAAKIAIPLYTVRNVLERAHSQKQPLHLKADFHYNINISKASAQYLWQEIGISIKNITTNKD